MLKTAWKSNNGTDVKYDFVVYYNEEHERYVSVYDPNRLPEFMGSIGDCSRLPQERHFYKALLEDGEAYNPEKHNGHLRCPDGCGAHMKYHNADEENTSRFRVDKNSERRKHKDDCKYKPARKERRVQIDTTASRGVIEGQFNHRASNYIQNRMHDPRSRGEYESLKGRKVKHAATAEDFLKILKKRYWQTGLYVDQHKIIKGENFFVLTPHDIKALYEDINVMPSATHFRAMKFKTTMPGLELHASEKMSVTSDKVFLYHQSIETKNDGPRHYIVLRALPAEQGSDQARACFPHAGEYLVTGDVKPGEVIAREDAVIYYMDIKIHSPTQVVRDETGIIPEAIRRKPDNRSEIRREP